MLEDWLRSYRPEELFDADGRLRAGARGTGARGRAPHGRQSARQRRHAAARPAACRDFRDYAVDVPAPGVAGIGDTHVLGRSCATSSR